ncbi:MAG: leucine-rich repeat protein [Oscillospiraceae bacterium]|nr:leucine-rich repeat protein [Oscillospiraceae bacterium]
MKYDKVPVFPGWEIVDEIGQGSFGSVFEIKKTESYGDTEHSAMKMISIPSSQNEVKSYRDEGLDDRSITALFKSKMEDITAEFSLMSKLKGTSNIVSYEDHSVSTRDGGIGWDILIRMELLTSLPDYLAQFKGYDEKIVLRLAKDICSALMLCSRHDIIHRDIKPSNIFISKNGDFKLGDFGIAKTSDHTTIGTKAGTSNYMAPEVYNNRPYGANVDIYSLGMVLYWMMNERRGPFLPLPPEAPVVSQWAAATEKRMNGTPIPAPKNGSDALKAIVMKACAFDPKDRYQTAEDMWDDLQTMGQKKTAIPGVNNRTVYQKNPVKQVKRDPAEAEIEATIVDRPIVTEVKNQPAEIKSDTNNRKEKPKKEPKAKKEKPEKPVKKKKAPLLIAVVVAIAVLAAIVGGLFGGSGSDNSAVIDSDEVLYYVINDEVSLRYILNESDEAIILGFEYGDDLFGTLELPSEIDGHPVTEIGESAFYGRSGLRKVVLPGNLKIIGNYAFNGCSSLEVADLPDSVEYIGSYAFKNCANLQEVRIPTSTVTVESDAYGGCSGLTTLTILNPDCVFVDYTFRGCAALTNVSLPEGMSEIPAYMFSNCIALQVIILPESVRFIGSNAFSGCVALQEIQLPEGLETIEADTFAGCISLKKVVFGNGLSEIKRYAFDSCYALEEIVIPASVKKIDSGAFMLCSSLKTVKILGATEISLEAFNGCKALQEITLPESLTRFGSDIFKDCNQLQTVNYCGSEEMWKHIYNSDVVIPANVVFNYNYVEEAPQE